MISLKCRLLFLCLPAFLLLSCETPGHLETTGEKTFLATQSVEAGEPVALTRRAALSDWPVKGKITDSQIKECFRVNSEATIKQYSIFLAPFSAGEQKLLDRMASMKPPLVSRTNVERLKGILKEKALLAPREAARRGVMTERAVTPCSEDILFGAFDCVFATVGTWNGTPRYGDVVIRLKYSVCEKGWGTPWSGYNFLHWLRKKDDSRIDPELNCEGRHEINDDDRLLYLMFIISGRDWPLALGYEAVVFLRAQEHVSEEQKNEIIEKLLKEDDPEKFWNFFTGRHCGKGPMGYLEAKFPDAVPSEYFESIEVPKERFNEIISWPEAAPFLGIIKAAE